MMPGDLQKLMEAMAQADRRPDEVTMLESVSAQGSTNFFGSARPPKGARVKFVPPVTGVSTLSANQAK